MDSRDQIKDKVDIVELLGEYIEVKQSGTHSFKAICPFHSEKTPSLHISQDKGVWHCFGCSEGGDCFTFVMKMEGMDFPEAMQYLGKKVGVEIKRFSSKQSNERQRLIAINELAAKFFRKVLIDSPAASSARAYLENRSIEGDLAEKFAIGFAPDNWDTLAQFLNKKGYRALECEKAGLLLRKRSGTGVIDRFRNRVMIPLRDRHGNTIGFTGRVMPGADEKAGAKYMNTPETPVYHKGSMLFGLDLARQAIKRAGNVIIVEGNLDVVASHKAGVENVVASSGTALTEDQLNLIKRYTKTAVFSFDTDAAGFAAAKKGIAIARSLDMDVRVAIISPDDGKDPDDVVQKDPELWKKTTENTMPIMQYYIDQAVRGKDMSNVDDKRKIGAFLLPELAQISDVVEREHWLQIIADLLRVEMGVLREAIAKKRVMKAVKVSKVVESPKKKARPSKDEQAISLLLGLSVVDQVIGKEILEKVAIELVESESLKNLYKQIKNAYNATHSDFAEKTFFRRLREDLEHADEQELISLLDRVMLEAEQFLANTKAKQLQSQVDFLLQSLLDNVTKKRKKVIEMELRQAETAGDTQAIKLLLEEFNTLQ